MADLKVSRSDPLVGRRLVDGWRLRHLMRRVRSVLSFWPVFAIALGLLILRLPEAIFRAEFWADDARLYAQAMDWGPASIGTPYGGQLLIGHRAIVYLQTFVSPADAPLLGNAIALIAMAAVATFALSTRMPWDHRTGVVIVAGIVLLPASDQVVGNLAHVQWTVILWLALVAVSQEPQSLTGKRLESVGLALAVLSGPAAITLPLFYQSARRLTFVGVMTIVQVVVRFTIGSDREWVAGPIEWTLIPEVLLNRLTGVVMGPGQPRGVAVGIGVVFAFAITLLLTRSRLRWWILYFLLVPSLLGIVVGVPITATLLEGGGPRYFWMAGVAIVVLIAVNRRQPVAVALGILFVVGTITHFRLYPAPEMGWAERSRCIGGPVACSIPVAPGPRYTFEYDPARSSN